MSTDTVQLVMQKIAENLSVQGRKHIKEKNFALPKEEKYPIHDMEHARNALARVSQHGTPAEREAVRRKVYAKYPSLKKHFEQTHGESPMEKKVLRAHETGNISKSAAMKAAAMEVILGTLPDYAQSPALVDAAVKVAARELEQADKLGTLLDALEHVGE